MTSATDTFSTALSALRVAGDDVLREHQELILQVADLQRRLGEASAPPPPPPPAGSPTPTPPPATPTPTTPTPTTPTPSTPTPTVTPIPTAGALARDAAGWTVLPIPADARLVYVSSSAGSAANDGRSPAKPLNSIAAAAGLLRDGFPDRLLLKAGDTFTGPANVFGNWAKSGRSPAEPMVFGAYGDGARPHLVSSDVPINCYGDGPLHDLAIVGLHFTAGRRDPRAADFDPTAVVSHGIRFLRPTKNLLIEDCRIECFGNNIGVSRVSNFTLRRSVITDAWATDDGYFGQGLYVEQSDGLLIEENLFDHNGWLEPSPGVAIPAGAGPNLFRHNLYLQSDNTNNITLHGNLIARAASHGAWMRSGGQCQGNLFSDNALHLQIAGDRGDVAGNVMLGGHDIGPNVRGFGVSMLSRRGTCSGNLLSTKAGVSPLAGCAIGIDTHAFTTPGDRLIEVTGNLVFDWAGTGIEIGPFQGEARINSNQVDRHPAGRMLADLRTVPSKMTWTANRYRSMDADPTGSFRMQTRRVAWALWQATAGEAGSSAAAALTASSTTPALPALPALLASARLQSRQNWRPDLLAAAGVSLLLQVPHS